MVFPLSNIMIRFLTNVPFASATNKQKTQVVAPQWRLPIQCKVFQSILHSPKKFPNILFDVFFIKGVCAFLFGANLPAKFWPYAFHHMLQMKNSVASSPIKLTFGQKENFKKLVTFDYRTWVRPPCPHGRQKRGTIPDDSILCIFLRFKQDSIKIITWYTQVNSASNFAFDEFFPWSSFNQALF